MYHCKKRGFKEKKRIPYYTQKDLFFIVEEVKWSLFLF